MKITFCPICGFDKFVSVDTWTIKGKQFVSCVNCGVRGREYETRKEAIEHWNNMVPASRLHEVKEFLYVSIQPCPICESHEHIVFMVDEIAKVYTVDCLFCEFGTYQSKTIQEAMDRWNSWRRK